MTQRPMEPQAGEPARVTAPDWTPMQHGGRPDGALFKVFSAAKTLEYFKAAELRKNSPAAIKARRELRTTASSL